MSLAKKTYDKTNGVIWYDPDVLAQPDPNLFDPSWLMENGYHQGSSTGRNQAHILRVDGRDMVLRHYYRGGLIGKLNKDLFLRGPVGRSRAMQEFQLLQWMRKQGLPVPRPVASRFVAAGIFYRADLIMEQIPDARTLSQTLARSALPKQNWRQIGEVIGKMHKLGVHHTDLNCHNILIDKTDQVWLIDFDKCRRRSVGTWTERNLARLKRSLNKEAAQQKGFHWTDDAWPALLAGYESGRD